MKFIKKSDLFIIASIIAVSVTAWILFNLLSVSEKTIAEIYVDSELIETIELNNAEDTYFSLDIKPQVIFHITAEGTISFVESDCPDKVCINAGKLSKPGHFAACLPNGVVLRIKNYETQEDDLDIIVGNTGGR
jgi:hypothetical protein